MKLIVGLGNPGDTYRETRHNIGFSVVKALGKVSGIEFKKDRATFSLNGRGKIGSRNLALALPVTFMNLSGASVRGLLKKYRVGPQDLLVVCDDMDLEFGRQKIRPCGSSGGHKGLASIIEQISSRNFARLRVGIGRPPAHTVISDYVLSPFAKKEKEELKEVIDRAVECCRMWVAEDINQVMNIFNKRSQQ